MEDRSNVGCCRYEGSSSLANDAIEEGSNDAIEEGSVRAYRITNEEEKEDRSGTERGSSEEEDEGLVCKQATTTNRTTRIGTSVG